MIGTAWVITLCSSALVGYPVPDACRLQELPKSYIIDGVPYVSFAEAAAFNRKVHTISHPSLTACWAMIFEYYGKNPRPDFDKTWKEAFGESSNDAATRGWATREQKSNWTLELLKQRVSQGSPVMVRMSATAYAHYLNPPIEFMLRAQSKPIKGLSFERLDKRLDSGLVGAKMFSLDSFDVIKKSKVFENLDATVITGGAKQSDKKKTSINPARETVFETDRIVIGYDDEKRKVLVHDPSFGPATEYDYDVFMRMWQLIECDVEYADTRIDRQPSTATKYRARLPNELAAERYMNGVSLVFGDKVEEALAELQQGLAIGGISDGYKHILHFERSSVLLGVGRAKEALVEATLATQLVPENPAAWAILAAALPKTDEPDREVRAKEAKAKADSVLNGEEPIKRLCRAIPNEFLVFWLHPVRGWAGEAISSKRLTGMHLNLRVARPLQ